MNIPEGYKQVMPYLILENASKFISFTQNVFGAEEKFKEMRSENVIMHAEIKIGDCIIMFADATEEYMPQPAGFFIYIENADDTFKKAVNAEERL